MNHPGDAPPMGYRTLQDSTFDLIREWILDGSLSPGQKLPIREIARGLGLSTMPVREALARLEAIGLVVQQPHRGATVTDLSVRDLHDFYNVRLLLEPRVAELGAVGLDAGGLRRLNTVARAVRAAARRGDIRTVLGLDEQFLMIIYSALGNAELTRLVSSTWFRVKPYKLLFASTAHEDGCAFVEQAVLDLLGACTRGDCVEVGAVVRRTLEDAHLRLTGLLERSEHRARTEPAARRESVAALFHRLATDRPAGR